MAEERTQRPSCRASGDRSRQLVPQLSGLQIVADPESCNANHILENRLASEYQTPYFEFCQHPQKAGSLETTIDGGATATLLVNSFRQPRQWVRLARIKLFQQSFNFFLVVRCNDTHPGGMTMSAYRSRNRLSLSTAARFSIGDVSETTINFH